VKCQCYTFDKYLKMRFPTTPLDTGRETKLPERVSLTTVVAAASSGHSNKNHFSIHSPTIPFTTKKQKSMPALLLLPLLFLTGLVAGLVDSIASGGRLITIPVLLGIAVPQQKRHSKTLSSHKRKGLFQIAAQVIGILDSDGETEDAVAGKLAVRDFLGRSERE
jgi:hypothetical protein